MFRSPLVSIVLIVLVDLLGFTIVMPLLPRYAEQFGFGDDQVGLLFAAYPMLQLIAGPILGRLSDRFGRRPVLIVSQAGTALSFLIMGLTSNFTVMLLARMLDGASGGNILVAQAYVADVTKPENRARSLGMIGAAFGVGFVLGPLLCGLLVKLPVGPVWQLRLPFLVAAGFSTLAWLLVFFRLPESLPPGDRARQAARVATWRGLVETVTVLRIGMLVAVGALVVLGFAALEGTYSKFLMLRIPDFDVSQAAYWLASLGLVSAIVQGGLIRRLVPRFGEPKLIIVGIMTLATGFVVMALANRWPSLFLAALFIGVGHGLASPTIQGLLSRVTPAADQGAIFGVLSSAQTFSRMANYLIANHLLALGQPAAPYWEAVGILAVALLIAAGVASRLGPLPLRDAREPGGDGGKVAAEATAS